jgi:hypothetical protein
MRGTRLLLTLFAIVVSACDLFGPEITCGPLPGVECDQQVQEIQTIIARDFPARRVVLIEFLNEDGDANVRLDDGTEVGWGGRDRR